MSEELKPCPFCGHVGLDFSDGSTYRWLSYCCGNCGIGNEVRRSRSDERTVEEDLQDTKNRAISEWNERVPFDQFLCQDLDKGLSRALSEKPDALRHVRSKVVSDEKIAVDCHKEQG